MDFEYFQVAYTMDVEYFFKSLHTAAREKQRDDWLDDLLEENVLNLKMLWLKSAST